MVTQIVHHGILLQVLESEIIEARSQGQLILTLDELAQMLPPRSPEAIRLLACRAETAGLLRRVTRGVYLDPVSYDGNSLDCLTRIAASLRPGVFNYISLESCARGYGGQSPCASALTVMTGGRSARIETIFGVLELVHTKRPRSSLEPRTRLVPQVSLPVASRELLEEDLAATGREVRWSDEGIAVNQ